MSHGLIQDANEVVWTEFIIHRSTPVRGPALYVANAGSIAPTLGIMFSETLAKPLAANSVLLDGPGLLSLAGSLRSAVARWQKSVVGLLLEIRWNRSTNSLRSYEVCWGRALSNGAISIGGSVAMLERPVNSRQSILEGSARTTGTSSTLVIKQIVDSIDVPFDVPEFQRKRASLVIERFPKLNGFWGPGRAAREYNDRPWQHDCMNAQTA